MSEFSGFTTHTLKFSPVPALSFHNEGQTARIWFRNGALEYEGELPPNEGARLFLEHAGGYFRSMLDAEVEKRTKEAAARIEALEADQRRLDWIEKNVSAIRDIGWLNSFDGDLRTAIDRAALPHP